MEAAESIPCCSELRVSTRDDPGVQVLPFPLSTRNRTECPAATEIRSARSEDHRRDAAWFGAGAAIKQKAWDEAMKLVA